MLEAEASDSDLQRPRSRCASVRKLCLTRRASLGRHRGSAHARVRLSARMERHSCASTALRLSS
eukprot:scaffold129355_cov63-Phaeocystis_antarctica.AAC.4